jgi:hypothetical protein
MNQKGFVKDLIIVILGVVILVGGYFYFSKKPANAPAETLSQTETADWKIYRSDKYGFEFKYPADWSVEEQKVYNNGVNILAPSSLQKGKEPLLIRVDPIDVGRDSVFDPGKESFVPGCKIKMIIFASKEAKDCTVETVLGFSRYIRVLDLVGTSWGPKNEISLSLSPGEQKLVGESFSQILTTFKFTK